jgi:hypothetical protein
MTNGRAFRLLKQLLQITTSVRSRLAKQPEYEHHIHDATRDDQELTRGLESLGQQIGLGFPIQGSVTGAHFIMGRID